MPILPEFNASLRNCFNCSSSVVLCVMLRSSHIHMVGGGGRYLLDRLTVSIRPFEPRVSQLAKTNRRNKIVPF